uniref:Uncharacterized protein n=1 Tax=Oryza brachyantha TaxID=4533 RepID=J3M5M5_ORYBR
MELMDFIVGCSAIYSQLLDKTDIYRHVYKIDTHIFHYRFQWCFYCYIACMLVVFPNVKLISIQFCFLNYISYFEHPLFFYIPLRRLHLLVQSLSVGSSM